MVICITDTTVRGSRSAPVLDTFQIKLAMLITTTLYVIYRIYHSEGTTRQTKLST